MIEAQKKMMKQRDNLDKLLEERSITIVGNQFEPMNSVTEMISDPIKVMH